MLTCEALVTPITKQYFIHTCECSKTYNYHAKGYKPLHISNRFPNVKALPGFFLRIFSSLTCLKKPIFSKRDLLRWKVPAIAVLGSSDERKVPASLSLFLKSEKIPALLQAGKGRDLSTGPSVFFDLFPQPTSLGHRSPCTQALLLYIVPNMFPMTCHQSHTLSHILCPNPLNG